MSYKSGTPNGTLYAGNVKWSNDYKHTMLFTSQSARDDFMQDNLSKLKNNVIYYNPNRYIDVAGRLQNAESYNYVFYSNDSDISSTKYCCFVTNYEYIAPDTTRLYIELDVFQMLIYSTNFYQSYIERAIISKSADNANTNYLPEPITAPLEYEKKLTDILESAKWEPAWVLHMASYYNSATGKYDYKGIGTNNTYGEYGRFIESQVEMDKVLTMYGRKGINEVLEDFNVMLDDTVDNFTQNGKEVLKSIIQGIFSGGISTTEGWNNMTGLAAISDIGSLADFQDHRDELLGLYAIPKWLKEAYIADGGNSNFADNRRSYKDVDLSINRNSLANGYTPRNKKLLTSVCRGYVLANKTGMRKAFKPELFDDNPTIRIAGITMATSGYQWHINNYHEITDSYGEVPYNSERRVGYDSNTGLNKAINTMGAISSVAGGVGALAGGIASKNPVGVIEGVNSGVNSLVNAVDMIGNQEQHIGNNGDLLRVTGGRAQLSWYEISPTLSECESIDNFFDMYGYAINKHANPRSYFNTRSVWNYIKCANVNLSCDAPADYENKLKNIFTSGVTLWHSYSNFGNYAKTNS
jgi:hypothetical protein